MGSEFLCDICDEVMEAGGIIVEKGAPKSHWTSLNDALDHVLKTGHRVDLVDDGS